MSDIKYKLTITGACEGHPADEFSPMGETVYCDGSCTTFTEIASGNTARVAYAAMKGLSRSYELDGFTVVAKKVRH